MLQYKKSHQYFCTILLLLLSYLFQSCLSLTHFMPALITLGTILLCIVVLQVRLNVKQQMYKQHILTPKSLQNTAVWLEV